MEANVENIEEQQPQQCSSQEDVPTSDPRPPSPADTDSSCELIDLDCGDKHEPSRCKFLWKLKHRGCEKLKHHGPGHEHWKCKKHHKCFKYGKCGYPQNVHHEQEHHKGHHGKHGKCGENQPEQHEVPDETCQSKGHHEQHVNREHNHCRHPHDMCKFKKYHKGLRHHGKHGKCGEHHHEQQEVPDETCQSKQHHGEHVQHQHNYCMNPHDMCRFKKYRKELRHHGKHGKCRQHEIPDETCPFKHHHEKHLDCEEYPIYHKHHGHYKFGKKHFMGHKKHHGFRMHKMHCC